MADKKLTKEELIEAFKELSLIELSEFVKLFEETFDVTAAAPVAAVAVAGAPASGGEAPAGEEKSKFDVVLEGFGDQKMAVLKAVREIDSSLGIAEAKAKVDAVPTTISEGVKKEVAEEQKAKLEAAGGTVTLK